MSQTFDVIVVGLGCVGLSACYQLAKNGYKVLGLEQNPVSGDLGGSTVGNCRIYRHVHDEERYYKMMLESIEMWKEIEKETGKRILVKEGMLYAMAPSNPSFEETCKYGELLTAEQLNKRFPAMNLPSYLKGVFDPEGGVVMVREALDSTKELALKSGATLKYNATVSSIDHSGGIVVMADGQKYEGKQVVISCGVMSPKFQRTPTQFKSHTQQVNCFYVDDPKGLPATFMIEDYKPAQSQVVFGTLEGAKLNQYKFGNELNSDVHQHLEFMKDLFPDKVRLIQYVMPCFYSVTEDDEFIFEKDGKMIYAFGLCGRGFKHMPYHGRRVLNLVQGNIAEANKYALKDPKPKL